MSIKFEEKEFGKTGRGVEGEKYKANQLTDESIDHSSVDTLMADAFSVLENYGAPGSLETLAEALRVGFNRLYKSKAGGSDEISKLARALVAAGLTGGKSKADIEGLLRSKGGNLFS